MPILRNAAESVLDVLYPRFCEGCGSTVSLSGHLCWECLRKAEKTAPPFCDKCGDPVDGLVEGVYECSWCTRVRPAFSKARSAFRFRGPVKAMIHQFKYCGGIHLAAEMADVMSALVRSLYADVQFDLVLGVPLFSRKERERGYNQSALLAGAVARRLGVDCFNRAVVRTKDTQTQTELKGGERLRNVKGAFSVSHPDWVRERNVLLVDDVMTTGATVAEMSRILAGAGTLTVNVITLARG